MSATSNKTACGRGHRKRRRWFQFGIGSLLLLMLACGVLFAYVASYRREYEGEKRTVAAIEEISGKCEMAQRGAAWLRWLTGESSLRVVGVDLSARSVEVYFSHKGRCRAYTLRQPLTDAWLSQLDGLRHLEQLRLSGNSFQGEGFRVLQYLPRLRTLDLSYCGIDDRAAEYLKSLHQLRSLNLTHTAITDAGLQQLSRLTRLKEIAVGPDPLYSAILSSPFEAHMTSDVTPRITEDGLWHLRALRQLEKLRINGISISEAQIKAFQDLPALKELDLSGSRYLRVDQVWEPPGDEWSEEVSDDPVDGFFFR